MNLLLVVTGLCAVIMLCLSCYFMGLKSGAAARRRLHERYVQRILELRDARPDVSPQVARGDRSGRLLPL